MSSTKGGKASEEGKKPKTRIVQSETSFEELNLAVDRRLKKAIRWQGWTNATLVQAAAIPEALKGRNLMVKAKTGSGKTAAYAIPMLNKLLEAASRTGSFGKGVRAVVLVPTKELVNQTKRAIEGLMYFFPKAPGPVLSIAADRSVESEEIALKSGPCIYISTPARLVGHVKKGVASLSSVETLVIDEADLVLSHGYRDDLDTIIEALPKIYQSFLVSATLSSELKEMKRVVARNAVMIKLDEDRSGGKLTQFYLKVVDDDKFLLLLALIKLRLIAGKILIFVNSVDRCFKLKLFMERFSIGAAVLNAELPANSRAHIIDQFNKGIFDFLIATDESMAGLVEEGDDSESDSDSSDHDDGAVGGGGGGGGSGVDSDGSKSGDSDEESADDSDDDEDSGEDLSRDADARAKKAKVEGKETESQPKGQGKKASTKKQKNKDRKGRRVWHDREFGVVRGVDFRDVGTVINFDLPKKNSNYTHRVGRTARGGAHGFALSFVHPGPLEMEQLAKIQKKQPPSDDGGAQPTPLPLNKSDVEGFRYRVTDVLKGITTSAIKDARLAEIKQEIINSERLKAHFADNPRDLQVLRHDGALQPSKVHRHLATVPDYLLPASLQAAAVTAGGGVDSRRKKRSRRDLESSDALKAFAYNANVVGSHGDKNKVRGRAGKALESTSGRQRWKMMHKKGAWSNKKRHSKKVHAF